MRRFLPLLLLVSLCGCTVIKLENGDLHRFDGFAEIRVVDDKKPLVVESRMYGFHLGKNAAILGYSTERKIYVEDQEACRFFIFFENEDTDEMADWKKLFSENPDICLVGGGIK